MEMNIIVEPVSNPTVRTVTTVAPPVQPSPPAPTPTSIPLPINPASPLLFKPNFIPPSALAIQARAPSPKIPARPKPIATDKSNNSFQGASEAQPDELYNQPPAYPEESREACEEGIVMLRVDVTAAGDPVDVNILSSSGYFRLDQAARRAVLHWRFHPALHAGMPAPCEVEVPVHFKFQ